MWRRPGVRGRLLLAFFGISAFAVIAAAAGLYSFAEVGRMLGRITEERVPPALASLELSRQAARIVAAAPALLAVTSNDQLREVSASIAGEVGKLEASLRDLQGSEIHPATLVAIEPAVDGLQRNLTAINALITNRLAIAARREDLLRRLSSTNIATQRLVAPGILVMDSKIAAWRRTSSDPGFPNRLTRCCSRPASESAWRRSAGTTAKSPIGARSSVSASVPIACSTWRGLYLLPMGLATHHVHVWQSLLERAGFKLTDIPTGWDAFWSFWCDQVQPAVRKALGRDDVWGVGLPMSAAALDTHDQLIQFQLAYEAPWLSRDGRLQVDDPAVREGMVKALDAYTAIERQGCTPPDAVGWTNIDNNKAFLAQTVVMTLNTTLSIPGALRAERSDDYYENAATIDWPAGAGGQPLVIGGGAIVRAVVFKAGRNRALADEFVRFLVGGGWLAHWLTFAGDRWLPPMRRLVEQPFWLDSSDPHRMHAAVHTRPERPSWSRTGRSSWCGQVRICLSE